MVRWHINRRELHASAHTPTQNGRVPLIFLIFSAHNVYYMCEVCDKLASTAYSNKISNYMLEDAQRIVNSKEGIFFSQDVFPYTNPLLYLEPRVAVPKPTRYYQPMFVDNNMLNNTWTSGCMRSVGFSGNNILILTKFVTKKIGEPEKLDYYVLAKLNKSELSITEKNNEIRISFDGIINGTNIKNRQVEEHELKFDFIHQHNDNAILPKSRLASSRMYSKSIARAGRGILSRFEEYSVTVMHFAPHPIISQMHKELGFETALELQRKVYDILKSHLF